MSWGYAPDSAEALPAGSPEVSARVVGAAFPRPLARALAVPRIALSTQQLTLERRPGPPSLLRGLIGYWRFDEQPGSNLARDISGAANHCLLQKLDTQGVWGEGALAGSLKLDGRGWLECRNTERLVRIEGELTIAAWVTRGRLVRNYHVVMARQKDSGRRDELFFGFANGDLAFVSHVLGVKIIRPLPPDLPHWFHIAIARHDDGTSILFVNGVEVGRSPGAWARLAGGDNPMHHRRRDQRPQPDEDRIPLRRRGGRAGPLSPGPLRRGDQAPRHQTPTPRPQRRGRQGLSCVTLPASMTQTPPLSRDDCGSAGRVQPVIDRNRCEGKTECVKACPYSVFEMAVLDQEQRRTLSVLGRLKGFFHGYRQAVAVRADDCHGCGLCVKVCPEKAITLAKAP